MAETPEVLIADDEEGICFSLKRFLEAKSYVTHVVADGRAALEMIRARGDRIGVVFLDVMMPRMGGFEALTAIRHLAPGVRCCLMTAHRRDASLDWSHVDPSVPILDKPFALAEFVAALERLISPDRSTIRNAAETSFKRVAILLPDHGSVSGGVVRGVARYARADKPWLIAVHGAGDVSAALVECDGLIATVRTAALASAIRAWGGPVVDAAGDFPDAPCPRVGFNAAAIGSRAAEHLLQLGSRNLAFVGSPNAATTNCVLQGFTDRLGPGRPCAVAPQNVSVQGPLKLTVAWLHSLPRPVAVFAGDDALAFMLGEACRVAGLRVPEDVALLGVSDDEILCEAAQPPLSSVSLPAEVVGYEAARMLAELMSGIALQCALVEFPPAGVATRRSTDVTAVDDPELAASLRFIRDHATERIGVEDIVAAGTLSRSSLERRFRAIMGRSPLAELLRVRVERAEQLLIATEMSVEEVARSAGFRDADHLTSTFRARGNSSPAQFRSLHRRG